MLVDSDIPEHHNNRDKDIEDWEEAKQFITDLRSQMKRIDSNLDEYIHNLRTNKKKNVMYINGTCDNEIYMWVMYDYLHSIPGICNIEFNTSIWNRSYQLSLMKNLKLNYLMIY